MGTSALNIAVENLFSVEWGDTTPVKYDNVPFVTPATSWVELTIMDGPSKKMSLGAGVQLRRSLGTVFVTVYCPIDLGSKQARQYADQVVDIFRDVQVSGITFHEPSKQRRGESHYPNTGASANTSGSTAKWYQMSVAIPYHYDEYI